MKIYPSQERLRELFNYDPEIGLIWSSGQMAGERAGGLYISKKTMNTMPEIKINQHKYNLLKIIWIYHNGEIKDNCYIKTRDVYSHPKIEHLRVSKKKQECHSKIKNKRGGEVEFAGVSKNKIGNFVAKGFKDGKQVYLGTYKTAESAASAYDNWVLNSYGGGFLPNNSGCKNYEDYRINSCIVRKMKNKSGMRGVYKNTKKSKNSKKEWISTISVNKKAKYLGAFETKEEAARAYNIAARNHYGDLAILNDIPNPLGEVF